MPASTSPRRAGNLPSELTSFVGRRHEIAEIKRLLSESRLVTITGVGGAGKTRLSLRVAADLQRAFPDGVWFVELAALEDHALLTQTIASALGVHERTTRWPIPALAEYLSTKQMLLVLDNCEHLRDACAVFADTVLRAASKLRILTTSRQALGLTGEHIFQVPIMSVPDIDRLPPLEALTQYEAVNLFLSRATAVKPTFALSNANFRTVAKVCQQLDGLPLAIELTAVRLRALSIEEILERLEDRYRLLTAGSPGALPRHQTLRALIDWSNDLCSEQERELWTRLSVFSGGFDLAATEAICAGGGLQESVILELLAALVDKSIVIAEEHGGRIRYRMLETIREYGQERLRRYDGEYEIKERHCAYFDDMVEQACTQWCGPGQEQLLSRLFREHNNIRAALEFCLTDPGKAERGLKIASALWFYWIATGLTSEGRRWLERMLELETPPTPWRAKALWVCAYLCIFQEDITAAEPMIAECKRRAKDFLDADSAAWAVQLSGMAAMSAGDLEEARTHLEDGLNRHRICGDEVGILDICFYLVAVTALLGELHRAAELCEEALALCDSYSERWLKSYMLWDLGFVAWQLGDGSGAVSSGRDGLRLARKFNEQWAIAFCIELLAWTANTDLQHERAARLLGCADSIWRRIGAPLFGMRHLVHHHEQCFDGVRDALGARPFDTEFRAGAQMGLDQAIAYALDEHTLTSVSTSSGAASTVPLTPREIEVAGLIAEGLSNKAIAAKLVIARRTAEAHVEHILGKLGFSSRAQVAAWVAESRSVDTGTSETA